MKLYKYVLKRTFVRTQRRAKKEDIETIFKYRGCGFSMEQISEITNLSPQTVSYQLSKLKKSVQFNKYFFYSKIQL